jgi:hypothetical protein
MCQTQRCSCFAAGRPCTRCHSFDIKCCNKEALKKTYCKIIVTTVPETDESPAPAEVSNLASNPEINDDKSSEEAEDTVEAEESRDPVASNRQDQPAGRTDEEERNVGDLPGAHISEADLLLEKVFGDYVHQNPGTHLNGGIADDVDWQEYWSRLIVFPGSQYDAPKGAVGRRFVEMVADLLDGVKNRKLNSEKFLVFQMVILQRTRDVKRSRDIRKRLSDRMDAWDEGRFPMLVQTTEGDMKANLSAKQGNTTPEQRVKIYNQKILRGGLRSGVRYLTNREKGGILMPGDIDEKTGDSVANVLKSKHPDARVPDASLLPTYSETPDFVDLSITEDVVETVAKRLAGSAGLGGTDAHALTNWLLQFGVASQKLRVALAGFAEWMANEFPPWAAYRGIMAGRLLALDKSPGIRPIGVGETWRRAIAKCILQAAGKDAKEACGTDQLCAGLEAGLEGGIHAAQHMWDEHHMEEEWGFLLVDARNAFNEQNRTGMLWTVRHEWPSGARFAFNCYRHWGTLVIRGNNGTGVFLFSKEGVTQGDPLAMLCYGLGVLPLIRILKEEFPDVKQPWYADDAAAAAKFDAMRRQYLKLVELGPNYGYFAEPTKTILIVSPHNLEKGRTAFADFGFQVDTGARYLGAFIGDKEACDAWTEEKVDSWAEAVKELASAAKDFPQSTYAGMQKSLQMEWQFVGRVMKGIGVKLSKLEKTIAEIFLPALYGEKYDHDDPGDPRRSLACLPVKHAGLALPDPTKSADSNFMASQLLSSCVTAALRGREDFRSADHEATMHAVKHELKTRVKTENDSELALIVSQMSRDDRRTIMRGKETGAWLSATPSEVNGTVLSKQEFRDTLLIRCARSPGDLPSHCDGCGAKCSVRHALQCKHGGLDIGRHDEIKGELGDLGTKALGSIAVRDEPRINPCRPAEEPKGPGQPNTQNARYLRKHGNDERGDLLLRGVWERQQDCIIDIRCTDTDAKSNLSKDPAKVLDQHEREKKKKYLAACLAQRRHFTPFVVSTDGLLGKEAKTLLKKLSSMLAEKWGKPYSVVCGYVNARMSIAIVRATNRCLRGSRIPTSKMSNRLPQWEDKAGLGLFRY